MSRALQISAITGAAIAILVLYLYRKKKLKEDHAILWLFVSISIVVLSTWTDLLLMINVLVGAANVTDVVLAAFVAFLLLVCIYYSVKISELTERSKSLAQEVALLKAITTTLDKKNDNERS